MAPDARAALAILKAARARIADPAHWCRGALARTLNGVEVLPKHPGASKWCLLGALLAEEEVSTHDLAYRCLNMAGQLLYWTGYLNHINDICGHAAALAVYDAAISALETGTCKAT